MSDPLYELLAPHLQKQKAGGESSNLHELDLSTKYLSRLLSLRLSDLATTEPQSLAQSTHSTQVSLQALSSRSHRTITTSASHLSTLHATLPSLSRNVTDVREAVPSLDESAVTFASTYARSRDVENQALQTRKESMLLVRQSDKLTDILELPTLLSTAIASAGSGTIGGANYSQALDLHAHIKRLSIIYPDSSLVKAVQAEAELAMKSMTTNLITSLRSPNIRLAAAIRTVGWLRRVVPELSSHSTPPQPPSQPSTGLTLPTESAQSEGSFGALFLVSRLHTFLTMTEALAPLRDLADQETERRLATQKTTTTAQSTTPARRPSTTTPSFTGTQTERYLKRYIEIFREQSFSTISMYRNIFPSSEAGSAANATAEPLALPSALQQFPLHLVEIFMEVLRVYLANVTDPAARESLLMQVLYAANSLGRLGADFSMMISLLDEGTGVEEHGAEPDQNDTDGDEHDTAVEKAESTRTEPEWARIIKKHKVQAARLDALATGPSQASRRGADISVR